MAPFIFATYVLVPRLERLRDVFQYRLLPEYDKLNGHPQNIILDYVSPVPEDRIFRQSVMQGKPEAFYANEFRALAGLPPADELEDVLMSGGSAVPALMSGWSAVPAPMPQEEGDQAEEMVGELDDEEAKQLDRLLLKMAKVR